jgi:uncharacterized protein (DUF2062 family)
MDAVVGLQMMLELLATREDLAAGCAVGSAVEFVALPRLELRVLAVLMPLPVVLAAEGPRAVAESAAVWLFVPLLVFPESGVSKWSWSVCCGHLLQLALPWECLLARLVWACVLGRLA